MTEDRDHKASVGARAAEFAAQRLSAPSADAAATDDAFALLRLAALDADADRLRESMAAMVEPLESQRQGLAALAELIEKDRPLGTAQESREILAARRRRLLNNERTHVELTSAVERDEADALAMSRELRKKAARVAEERNAVLAGGSRSLRERHEEALREGRRPTLAAVRQGRCPDCGQQLPYASQRLVQGRLCVVPCPGCLRLLYDPGWTEPERMPSTLPVVTKGGP